MLYFISGVRGHYDRGKRLIIKVFDVEPATTPPPQYANENAQNPPHKKNGVPQMTPMTIILSFVSIKRNHNHKAIL